MSGLGSAGEPADPSGVVGQSRSDAASRDDDSVEMAAHYLAGVEEDRLSTWGRLEFVRTMEILRRHLPPPPAVVADIGGGPGAYALPLAAEGYRVHLVDAMPLHVDQVQRASVGSNAALASAAVGDARDLPWPDETIDVALLLGPLYHLTALEDRLTALAEARRVLRRGGVLAAAAIGRFASALDGLARRFLAEPEFQAIVERDVRDGQHRNPGRHPDWFTSAYFHLPGELADEVRRSGFALDALLAVEGPAGWLGDLDWWLEDDDRREVLLATIRRVEAEPSLLGASSHLLAVARRA
jgi:SAM-dependent methyltransferase